MTTFNDTQSPEISQKKQGPRGTGRSLWRIPALSLIMMLGAAQAVAQTPINSWADLHNVRNNLSGDYILNTDLGMGSAGYNTYASSSANGGLGWEPVGTLATPFTGSFDGNGFTISGLNVMRPSTSNVGLFGAATGASSFTNVSLEFVTIEGNISVGALVGNFQGTTIEGCKVSLGTVKGEYDVGGLIGEGGSLGSPASYSIMSSSSTVNVEGLGGIGGLAGRLWSMGSVEDSFAACHISGGNGEFVGGLIGIATSVTITGCYASGLMDEGGVYRNSNGGLVGGMAANSSITDSFTVTRLTGILLGIRHGGVFGNAEQSTSISNVYSSATIESSSSQQAGFAGHFSSANPVSSSYWNSDLAPSGIPSVYDGSDAGITPLTNTQMTHPASGGTCQ